MSTHPLLLIVEDDDALRGRLGRALQERGYDVRMAASAAEAERLITEEPPELALLDLRLEVAHHRG